MTKKQHVRTLMERQHIKGSERLLKSAREYFCRFFLSLWKAISSRESVLEVFEILKLFLNTLAQDDKYYLSLKAGV